MSLVVTPPLLWTAGTIFPVVCTAVVGGRFAARRAQRARVGWDDWLSLPALILIWAMAIDIMIGTGQGSVGYPTPQTAEGAQSPEERIIRKVYFSITLLQIAALVFIKVSCMLFLGRIFRTGANRAFDIFYYFYIVVTIGWFLSFFFAYLLACGTHVSRNWGTFAEATTCPANFVQINSGMSILDLILDVFLLIFPIPYVWSLNMNVARKLLVTFIFLLGSMAILASIARVTIIELELDAIFLASTDQNLIATAVVYFMYLEACFGLLSICLPSLSGLTKYKSVQNLVAGLISVLSTLSGSSRASSKKNSQTRELNANKAHDATSSASGQSEDDIPLNSVVVAGAASDRVYTWAQHDCQLDYEMPSHTTQDQIQVSRTFGTSRN